MHNACTPLNSMSFLMITHCLNQCLRARLIQWTKLCSPAAAYGWWLPQLMPIHFERGWFLYDAQEWENLEMRGWGRCLRKTKLHFVRKDKFIDICFGEYKRLSWDLYWVLCPEEFYYWLIKVVRKQSGENEKWQVQYLYNAISLIWLCFWRSVKFLISVVSSIFAQSGKLI